MSNLIPDLLILLSAIVLFFALLFLYRSFRVLLVWHDSAAIRTAVITHFEDLQSLEETRNPHQKADQRNEICRSQFERARQEAGTEAKQLIEQRITQSQHLDDLSNQTDISSGMKCPKCGTNNDTDANYCKKCGESMATGVEP